MSARAKMYKRSLINEDLEPDRINHLINHIEIKTQSDYIRYFNYLQLLESITDSKPRLYYCEYCEEIKEVELFASDIQGDPLLCLDHREEALILELDYMLNN